MDCIAFLSSESKESRARKILEHTRKLIMEAAGLSVDDWFYINRFVYARLQLEERAQKPAKTALFRKQDGKCYLCKKPIENLKVADIHRLNEGKWYLEEGNAVLVHRTCHQQP
jgi:hypothetical protein